MSHIIETAAQSNSKSAGQDKFQSHDYYWVDELLSPEHLLIRESVRAWVKKEVSPIIEDYAQRAQFPRHLVRQLGEIGAFGPTIPTEYGGQGLDYISYGIIMQELERGDSGIRSTASVQSSLVMYPIYTYGSEEQRMKYLPKLGSGEWLGSFGLTEPNYGSNPSGMITRIEDKGDYYLLNGAKMWISNAPFCDVAVVWAKDDAGDIRGVIVERGMEGFTTPETHGKWSLRASATGELVFDNVRLPKENLLPKAKGFYKEAGLDVILRPNGYNGSFVSPVDAVVSGDAQFGISNSGLVLDYLNGKPVVALAATLQHSAVSWLVLEKSGIRSIHDMVNKRLMTVFPLSESLELLEPFRAEGIDPKKLNLTQTIFDLQPLIDGKID
ncbi:MAG TPA: acyl-CoA dehydrogenase family protein, partial [Chitinophagales bacterium]|nr:acyl-CoA dehydrogenase family protein [Chitinophagales bacterium]